MTSVSFEQKELALKEIDITKNFSKFLGKNKLGKEQTQKIMRTNSKILF